MKQNEVNKDGSQEALPSERHIQLIALAHNKERLSSCAYQADYDFPVRPPIHIWRQEHFTSPLLAIFMKQPA